MAPAAAAQETTFIPFEGLQQAPPYDLRFYKPRYVVDMAYERRDEGFIALGNYLAGMPSLSIPSKECLHLLQASKAMTSHPHGPGKNEAGVRMEATQPVVMRYDPSVSHLDHCTTLSELPSQCR